MPEQFSHLYQVSTASTCQYSDIEEWIMRCDNTCCQHDRELCLNQLHACRCETCFSMPCLGVTSIFYTTCYTVISSSNMHGLPSFTLYILLEYWDIVDIQFYFFKFDIIQNSNTQKTEFTQIMSNKKDHFTFTHETFNY